MKLASLKDGSRDGQLVVVSRDLATAHYASGIASRLQQVLDDWGFLSPPLQDLYDDVNHGRARHSFPFDPRQCMAPLPRAFQCLQATPSAASVPSLHQLTGDALEGACGDIVTANAALQADFGAGLAVVTGDVAAGCSPEQALDGVRLLMLANTLTLRAPERLEAAAGWGPIHSRPATAFSPVTVTLDELGAAWQRGRAQLTLQVVWNGRKFGLCDAEAGMPFGFGELIAHACKTRALRAGSIVCSGPLGTSVQADPLTSRPDVARGHSSIAGKRAADAQGSKKPTTDFLQPGDTVRIEMKGPGGTSLLGAIEQQVADSASRARDDVPA